MIALSSFLLVTWAGLYRLARITEATSRRNQEARTEARREFLRAYRWNNTPIFRD